MGTVSRITEKGEREVVALLFVYPLLSSKESNQYASGRQTVVTATGEYEIRNRQPEMIIIIDFDLAAMNACTDVLPDMPISLCFSHLVQSLHRKIQEQGLQVAYNDQDDGTIKDFTHMVAALTFV